MIQPPQIPNRNLFHFFSKKLLHILFIGLMILLLSGCSSDPYTSYSDDSYRDGDYASEENVISREDAISDYWDEIRDYLNGTKTVEACTDSGCYDLDADISSGYITTLYFNNGGYLDFYAPINNNGYAYDTDEDWNDWEFTISMYSYFVDNAVEEWAADNGYELE